jgi:TRAP-type transport system periplasmic protein
MKNTKRVISIFLTAILMITMLSACGSSETANPGDTTYTIKLATNSTADMTHPQNLASAYFEQILEERSDGAIDVEVYPNAQLGDARTIVEGVQLGTIEMGDVENGTMSGFVPEAALWDMPYLFSSLDQAHEVLDGEIGQKIQDLYLNIGIRHLAYNDGGFRYFTNSVRPVYSIADMKGLKIRVMESNVMINSINAFGASAVPMAFSELYTALQQGTVDGQENPLDLIYAQNYYEVQKYISLSEHFYYPRQYIIGEDFYQSLPSDLQEIVVTAAKDACTYQREQYALYLEKMMDALKDQGFEVCEFDKAEAMVVAEAVWPDFYETIGSGDAAAGEQIVQSIAATR